MDKTLLIECTAKRLKRWEFIVTTILFLTLFASLGLLYVAIPLAVAAWSLSGVCAGVYSRESGGLVVAWVIIRKKNVTRY